MFAVVTGGSGSGKSACAEELILSLGERKRYYIATMQARDEEGRARVRRHRAMRADKRFETIECPADLETAAVEPGSAVLLECMSNLAANEFFDGSSHTPEETAQKILAGLEKLRGQCKDLVVVTNEVFSDGMDYDAGTRAYLECLGRINCAMARRADRVIEVVCGIPVFLQTADVRREK